MVEGETERGGVKYRFIMCGRVSGRENILCTYYLKIILELMYIHLWGKFFRRSV